MTPILCEQKRISDERLAPTDGRSSANRQWLVNAYAADMAALILLNGPPASGKSTIAQRYVDARPLALNLDVDVVRGLLGRWLDEPYQAGLHARSLALAMAEAHLRAERDVIVPQFLGRHEFIGELAKLAAETKASFYETALWIDRTTAITVFENRRLAPTTQSHYDAAALVDRSEHEDPVGQMYDAFMALVESRPATRRIDVVHNNIEQTFINLMDALERSAS